MKSNSYLKTIPMMVLIALASASCCKDKKCQPQPKPQVSDVSYSIELADKTAKLTSITASGSKNQDSTINVDLDKNPRLVNFKRGMVKKGNVLVIKAKVDKPTKVTLKITVDNKLVKEAKDIDIKDIKTEAKLEHKM